MIFLLTSWNEGLKQTLILMGCLAGEGAFCKLSIESQAQVEKIGRNHHRFLPYCATEHGEMKEWGGEGHKLLPRSGF